MFKRLFDIVMSLLALAVVALPMLVIAVLIRMDSWGAAIFRQKRAGLRSKPFTMWKFRTMRVDTDSYGVSPKSGTDPRLTHLGKFLREKSLDELPQLFNVIAGQMSLVGPRPLYERQAELWDDRQKGRLDVRPGITGYAQAYGRAGVTLEEKIEMDLFYVANQSFLLDMKIIFRTVANILLGRAEIYEKRYSRDKESETD